MSTRRELKDEVFMAVASQLSVLSTCDRAQVGAVFVREGRCVTWGYNGAPPGLPHCDENIHGWRDLIIEQNPGDPLYDLDELAAEATAEHGCRNATHAEANALAFAARHGISVAGATCYVTVSPCEPCSRLLIAAGISAVYYQEVYRVGRGVELLHNAGIVNAHMGHEHV
jgi:dCMP deaminase